MAKMAKKASKVVFFCESCGFESLKWLGRCPGCNEFNTFVDAPKDVRIKSSSFHSLSSVDVPVSLPSVDLTEEFRLETEIGELNRVLGGGIVAGSLVLVGGEPGIGKSTLVLQMCEGIGKKGAVLYVSGEESLKQIKLRAERLGVTSANVLLYCETDIARVEAQMRTVRPLLTVVDSIQTLYDAELPSTPGSIGQVRDCTMRLMNVAKSEGIPVFLIGHVTKEGVIAGPRVLEHMVDTVLYFEGERSSNFRVLRAVKNRFGATDEMGVFEMQEAGLREVLSPSEIFLSQRAKNAPGSVVISSIEGTRALLLELQALVASSNLGFPRRQAIGLDPNRISLILAVLEKRVGYFLGSKDVYVNLAGGMKITEPAADLGAAVAIASSFKDVPVQEGIFMFGEVGLTGEVREVGHAKKRIKEAEKFGFTKALVPHSNYKEAADGKNAIEIIAVKTLRDAIQLALQK